MTDYGQRLKRLNDRRRGLYTKKGEYLWLEALTAAELHEKYASLPEPEAIRYAIGIMQAVEASYTETSWEEAKRVAGQLLKRIDEIPMEPRLQGSVPLDVHVRGNSDVDLLMLRTDYVTTDLIIDKAYGYVENGTDSRTALRHLRRRAANELKEAFPAADVDTTPSKCITISGGSLKRVVDVVPSNWHDTLQWKLSQLEEDHEIRVLDIKTNQAIVNRPFKHIAEVNRKDAAHNGNVKKLIRALKNLRYDASPKIENLSSYDIAAIVWNMTTAELTVGTRDLLLLERARMQLYRILTNTPYRESLQVPDGSREIYDADEKYAATGRLYDELKALIDDVARALAPYHILTEQAKTAALERSIHFG